MRRLNSYSFSLKSPFSWRPLWARATCWTLFPRLSNSAWGTWVSIYPRKARDTLGEEEERREGRKGKERGEEGGGDRGGKGGRGRREGRKGRKERKERGEEGEEGERGKGGGDRGEQSITHQSNTYTYTYWLTEMTEHIQFLCR